MRALLAWLTTQANTTRHRGWVAYHLLRYAHGEPRPRRRRALLVRSVCHDLSKYRRDETRAFVALALLPPGTPPGSAEHRAVVAAFDRQVELHYARNRHHPEHHAGGYPAMSEVDRIEMVADWLAASRRRPGGSIDRSIAEHADRYGYDQREAARLRAIATLMVGPSD